ncbi:MAG: type I restriction enzyme, R subunit [Candidatus Methanomarinus sp.]|nr:MAG: type I restriction enzyme, R subunit [ANME-2 cluster archaeon]
MLDVPFVYSSNGDAFLQHDRTQTSGELEKEIPLHAFPSPEDLWKSYCTWKNIDDTKSRIITQDYYTDGSQKTPRYYQLIAINRTIEAITRGQDRILLVMATGTGKTFTAFQIIWRLWKSRTKKRILLLADRNILVDQTRINDFKPFGPAMTKIHKRQADKSYEIYLSLYQAVTGTEEEKNIYKQFSPDFFGLIVVDECHRGSAAEDSAWHEILEYFSSATHIGLTATPKETKYVSNIHYFGDPVYTYSLKQGIEDGFLAPYKVVRIDLDKDLTGWRPEKNKLDKYGKEIEDRIYNQKDFDRDIVLDQRTQLVASKVTEYLNATDRFDKTIIFCENIDHAERMRQAIVNENGDLVAQNEKCVMLEELAEHVGKDFDPFDLICHVVYDQPPMSRKQRAEQVRKRDYFIQYGEQARKVLDALLNKYADEGIENIESMDVLRVKPINQFGTPLEIINIFGGKDKYLEAVKGMETQLYMAVA